MKKTILASIIAATFLAGCNSDDSSSAVDGGTAPEARSVSISTATPSGIELISTTEFQVNGSTTSIDGQEVKILVDNNGYQHALLINGYEFHVEDSIDGYGSDFNVKIEDISQEEAYQITVHGEAKISLQYKGTAFDSVFDGQSSPYYSAEGETKIEYYGTEFQINAENVRFSYVTIEGQIDYLDQALSTMNKGELFSNKYVGPSISPDHFYSYIVQKNSNLTLVDKENGIGKNIPVTLERTPEHFIYTASILNENDGTIIITPPFGGEPIELNPAPIQPIVAFDKISGATNLVVHEDATVSGKTQGHSVWVHSDMVAGTPVSDIENFTFLVNDDFSGGVFVNIYMKDANGEKADTESFYQGDSWVDFVDAHEGYTLRNYTDSGKGVGMVTGNFILRMGDSDYIGRENFIIKDYTLTYKGPTSPVVVEDQLKGLDILETNEETGSVVLEATSSAPAIYPSKEEFSTENTLDSYTLDFDIDSSYDDHNVYINVYLSPNGDNPFRCDIYMHLNGQKTEQVHCGNTIYPTIEKFVEDLGWTTVTSRMDSGRVKTNFIARFGDSTTDETGSQYKINKYTVKNKPAL